MSVEIADSQYQAALGAWAAHIAACEACSAVAADCPLEDALTDLCSEGRLIADAKIAAEAAAVAATRLQAGDGVRWVLAQELEAEMVTSDGQEILDVEWIEGGHVLYHVFTRSDDPDENEDRKAAPEARGAAFGKRVAIMATGRGYSPSAPDRISGDEAVRRIREALFLLDNGDPEERVALVERVRAIVDLAAPESTY